MREQSDWFGSSIQRQGEQGVCWISCGRRRGALGMGVVLRLCRKPQWYKHTESIDHSKWHPENETSPNLRLRFQWAAQKAVILPCRRYLPELDYICEDYCRSSVVNALTICRSTRRIRHWCGKGLWRARIHMDNTPPAMQDMVLEESGNCHESLHNNARHDCWALQRPLRNRTIEACHIYSWVKRSSQRWFWWDTVRVDVSRQKTQLYR